MAIRKAQFCVTASNTVTQHQVVQIFHLTSRCKLGAFHIAPSKQDAVWKLACALVPTLLSILISKQLWYTSRPDRISANILWNFLLHPSLLQAVHKMQMCRWPQASDTHSYRLGWAEQCQLSLTGFPADEWAPAGHSSITAGCYSCKSTNSKSTVMKLLTPPSPVCSLNEHWWNCKKYEQPLSCSNRIKVGYTILCLLSSVSRPSLVAHISHV